MASQRSAKPVRSAWVMGLLGMALALVLAPAFTTGAQEGLSKPPRVRTLLKTGLEHYKRGDYESAAAFFAQAQAGAAELTPTEQRDLKTFMQQNSVALQAQREGSAQLRQAEEALREGKTQEAGRLVRALTANQYLSAADRQALATLNDRLRTGGGKVVETMTVKSDPKSLLSAARAALEKGDVDLAEALTLQAEKSQTGFAAWIHTPWADTPAKLRRDIQAARSKQTTVVKETPKDAGGVLGAVKNLFRKDKVEDKMPAPVAPEGPVLVQGPELNPKPSLVKNPEPKSDPGKGVAQTPKGPFPPLPPWANSKQDPSKQEPAHPKDKTPGALVNLNKPEGPAVRQTTYPGMEDKQNAAAIKTQALALLREGRKALDAGDFETARKYALQARDLRADLGWQEENPERLLADIQRRSVAKSTQVVAKSGLTIADGRKMVRDARLLLQQGKIDEADALCQQAATVPKGWGLFEDTPDKLRGDIQRARSKRDREESARLLAEARKLLQQGNLQEAKRLAWQAQKLHGPYTIWDLGDRPQKLLDEIHRAETNKNGPVVPPPPSDLAQPKDQSNNKTQYPQVAAKTPNPPGGNGPGPKPPTPTSNTGKTVFGTIFGQTKNPKTPDAVQVTPPTPVAVSGTPAAAAKARAIVLVQEARDLMRKGLLLEAREKAGAAAAMKVAFAPGEDSPDSVLLDLASQATRQVDQMLLKATEIVLNSPTDPLRFQKAEANLAAARQLAQAFGQDTARIDQKNAWLQHAVLAVSNAANAPNPLVAKAPETQKPPLTPEQAKGWELLEKARLELKNGNTPMARRLAEEAFNPAFGLQAQAAALIRSIDAEEHNQRILAANRNADAGFDAYARKDFKYAANIFANLDLRLLHPEKAKRIGEIMNTPEMQPGERDKIQLVSNKEGPSSISSKPGTASASDLISVDDVGTTYKAMQEIQFQQMRDRALTAQKTALELFKTGHEQLATETLQDFLDQLKASQLDETKQALLRRPVENRLNQFRTIATQKSIEKTSSHFAMHHDEGQRLKNIEKTQKEVSELIKQYRTFQKEGKYKEALAAARKAKELDPDNLAADAAITIATIALRQREQDKHKANNEEMVYKELNTDQGDVYVNMEGPVRFNPEVLQRNQKYRETGKNGYWPNRKSPAEKAIERRLSEPVSLHFKDTPLSQVISDLQDLTNINVVPDTAALQDASISLDMPLSLAVDKISLKSALNLLLSKVRLTHQIKDEVLLITTPERAKGKLVQVVYPVADLVVPVDNHPTSPVHDMTQALARHIASQSGTHVQPPTPYTAPASLPYGQSVSSSASGPGSTFASAPNPHSMVSAPSGAPVRAPGQTMEELLMNLIQNTVAHDTWNSVGGPGTIQYYPLGMALVINQYQEVQEDVIALLASLRRLQDLEVAIEMRLVSVSESFFERIGLDFDVNIRTGTSRREPDLVNGQFTPFGFVNRNLDRMGLVSGLTPAGTLTPDLNIPLKSSSFDFSVPPFGGFPGTLGADGGLSLGLAFLSDIQVFMFMEAAQGDRRMNVMQAPKITVFNGQTANITVQDQQFFLTGVSLNQANAQIFFSPQNQPFPLGVNLQVTPVVSADRRFVRLNLQPQMTNLASTSVPLIPVQIPVPQVFEGPGSGNTQVGQPTIFQMFFQQPTFTTIFLDTTVNVPDGGTVLLGGLKTMAEARNEFGPPILSKIPYLSRLFKNVGYGREGQSLMIMVTPRIIINEEEEQIFLGQLPPIPRP